jgi:hypothetical protein
VKIKAKKPKYDTSFNFGANVKPKGGGKKGGKPKGAGGAGGS